MTDRCPRVIHWWDIDTDARCTHDSGHNGDHGDGDRWWDGHGLQTPRDQPAAVPTPRAIPIRKHDRKARLTDAQAVEIRRQHAAGHTNAEIARRFGVSDQTIWSIANHRTYRSAG
jgi:DNA-binding CsgD family transcriptional regulator